MVIVSTRYSERSRRPPRAPARRGAQTHRARRLLPRIRLDIRRDDVVGPVAVLETERQLRADLPERAVTSILRGVCVPIPLLGTSPLMTVTAFPAASSSASAPTGAPVAFFIHRSAATRPNFAMRSNWVRSRPPYPSAPRFCSE